MKSFATKSILASYWSLIEIAIRYGAQFITTLFLAHILTPKDFGLVAIILVFTTIGSVLAESGFGTALIQRKSNTADDEATVFIFSFVISILLAGLLCILAPHIADMFQEPLLIELIPWMSLTLPAGSLACVPNALLTRNLEFRKRAIVEVISSSISMGLAICLAVSGYGVWSLVWQYTIFSVTKTILLFRISGWQLRGHYRTSSFRSLFSFGGYILSALLLNAFTSRFQSLLVGKLIDTKSLGLYSFAQDVQSVPANVIGNLLNRIGLPVFSSITHDKDRLLAALRRMLRLSMFLFMPLMLFLAIAAKPLLEIIAGPQWTMAAPVFSILAVGTSLWPVHVLNLSALTALGHAKLLFRLQIIKDFSCIFMALIFVRWGISALALAITLSAFFSSYINTYYTKILLGYGWWAQVKDLISTLLCTAVASSMYLICISFIWGNWQGMIIAAFISAATYIGIAFFIEKETLLELIGCLRRIFRHRD